jgi:hypothetical protein
LDPSPIRHSNNPLPFTSIQLVSLGTVVIADVIVTKPILTPFTSSDVGEVIASNALGVLQSGTGNVVSLATCLSNLDACVWRFDGFEFRRDQYYLCFPMVRSTTACAIQPNNTMMFVSTVLNVRLRIPSLDTNTTWLVNLPAPSTRVYFINLDHSIRNLEIITLADLRADCVCPVYFDRNQTDLDNEWASESVRGLIAPTNYAVVPYRAHGDEVQTRVEVRGKIDENQTLVYSSRYGAFATSTLRFITSKEFTTGNARINVLC